MLHLRITKAVGLPRLHGQAVALPAHSQPRGARERQSCGQTKLHGHQVERPKVRGHLQAQGLGF